MVKEEQFLYFCALGGLEEIGLNCSVYGYGDLEKGDLIVVDLGLTFPSQESTPGTSVVVPDITWLVKNRKRIKGLIITHAHEDHIGALPYLWQELQCPIYTAPFTASVVREKMRRAGCKTAIRINEIKQSEPFQLGSFSCQLINITHSVPEARLLVLNTPEGRVVHTGDWKFDKQPLVGSLTDFDALDKLGQEGVLALMCDSTNVLTPGHSGSEVTVLKDLKKHLSKIKQGRIVLTHFSSNVARFAIAAKLAKLLKRKICVCGSSFSQFLKLGQQHNLLPDMNIIEEKTAANLPPGEVLILCSGSQGEINSSMTSLAEDRLRHLRLEKGDTVVFSNRVIPGNEMAVNRIYNLLAVKGVDIITVEDCVTHVSGHPCQDELKDMYKRLLPQILVPIHGDPYHLRKQAQLSEKANIQHCVFLQNGDVLALKADNPQVIGKIKTGKEYTSGYLRLNQHSSTFNERRRLMHKGIVYVSLNFNDEGYIRGYPDVAVYGVTDHKRDLIDGIILLLEQAVPARTNYRSVRLTKLQEELKHYLRSELGFLPIVHFAMNQ